MLSFLFCCINPRHIQFAIIFHDFIPARQLKKYKQNALNLYGHFAVKEFLILSCCIPVACQFKALYSFGDTPTLCLNSRVKCCGYLKPSS